MKRNSFSAYSWKLLALACGFSFTTCGIAQTDVRNYQPGITEEGVTYFLPHTRLLISVTARKTTYTPGEYSAYAQKYLRLKNVTRETTDQWELLNVSIQPYGVADRSQAYTIKLNTKSSAPLVSLTQDGRLLAINTQVEPEAPLPQPKIEKDGNATALNPNDFKTEEILAAGSTMKMAELAASEIYDIRENRSLLAKGQADFMPKDGAQLKMMMEQLDKQEAGLLMLFEGTKSSETQTFTFSYDPTTETSADVLFRFSKYFGPVSPDDLSGDPIYIRVKNVATTQAIAEEKKKKEEKDVRYIVPGKADVQIFDNQKQYASMSVSLAQFGRVEHLGGDLFNKRFTTQVQLYPETGGIKKISGEPAE